MSDSKKELTKEELERYLIQNPKFLEEMRAEQKRVAEQAMKEAAYAAKEGTSNRAARRAYERKLKKQKKRPL